MTAVNYKLLKGFQDDSRIRRGFNELTRQTYGFDFEDWYQNGYWTKSYRPYILNVNEQHTKANSFFALNCNIYDKGILMIK